jgi:predicted alpha/beta hydrolase family esterase
MSDSTKEPMKIRTLIMLHGFGVRGFFWDPYKHSDLQNKFHHIFTPDLNFKNIKTAVESTRDTVSFYHDKYGKLGPFYLVGHSLGGILAAILAKELGPEVISKIVLIASPYGESRSSERSIKIQRWLIKHDRLLPGFLTRPAFFTKKTPKNIQKTLWNKTVKETPEFIDEIISQKYFHTDLFTQPLVQKALVIASKHDKTVNIEQAETFAKVLGADTKIYEKVGHNDLVYAPNVASKVIQDINDFLLGN